MAQWILPADSRWAETLFEAEHDCYHLPCYVELASSLDPGEPRAFYDELPSGQLLIPLLVRNVPADICPGAGLLDATSPYGYPGPLFSDGISVSDAVKGIKEFIEFGKNSGLVTTFLRLHPFLSNKIWSAFSDDYQHIRMISHGTTVSIDLTLDTEELNARMRKNHRRNIQRLYKKGYTARIDDWSDYPKFMDIYHETMRRRSATAYYFFDHEYFAALRRCLGSSLHLCAIVSPSGEMAGGGLIIKTGGIVQAHLNATSDNYLAMAPSKLMFYEMRNWAKDSGARIFHLGGGVGGQQDSLYFYKRGMGTHEHRFETIGIIHDPQAYATLHDRWLTTRKPAANLDSGYFPFYRCTGIKT